MTPDLAKAIVAAIQAIDAMEAVEWGKGMFGRSLRGFSPQAIDEVAKSVIGHAGWKIAHDAAETADEKLRLENALTALPSARIDKARELAGIIAALAAVIDPVWAPIADALGADQEIDPSVTPETAAVAIFWMMVDGGSIAGALSIEAQTAG